MNTSNESTVPAHIQHMGYTVTQSTLYCLLSLAIVIRNVLAVAAVFKFRALRTITNKFIVSLSLADLLCAPALLLRYGFLEHSSSVTAWKAAVFYVMLPLLISQGMSLGTLMLIAVDRYIAVLHATSYKVLLTTRRATIAIAALWLYVVTLFTVCVAWFGGQEDDEELLEHRSLMNAMPSLVTAVIMPPHVYLALSITIALYVRIFLAIWKQQRKVKSTSSSENKAKKVTKLMAMVLGILLVCWLPRGLIDSVIDTRDENLGLVFFYLHDFSFFLVYFNSCINPLLYALKSPEFRKAYVKLVKRNLGKVGQELTATLVTSRETAVTRVSSTRDRF